MVPERSKEGAEDKGGETSNQTKQANDPQPSGLKESDDGTNGGEQVGTKTKRGAKEKIPASSKPKTTVITLREQLGRLGLSTKGIKAEHMSRLRQHEERDDTDEEGDTNKEVNKEGNGDTDGDEVDTEDEIDKEGSDVTSDSSRHKETSEEGREAARGVERNDARRRRRRTVRMERREHNMPSLFTIKDVEGSISYFSGDDKLQVEKWIDEFEDMSGTDNVEVDEEKSFETKANSALVHLQLSKSKRQANETPRQYVYAMSTIASQGDVEEEAVMQYIIDGIQDDEAAKSILYSACNIGVLRKNLERYDRMKEKTDGKTQKNKSKVVTKDNKSDKSRGEKAARCFGCGLNEHLARNCPKKDDGPKCSKGNKFGHIAAKCDGREKTTDGNVRSVNVVTRSSTDDEITVELDNVKIQAMIDTGVV
ncbi:17S U2 SnRNP complex component HTATSF1-like [Neodiprion pinetum]|uniref:17S U2 SnRNP complex component HTATSF1-like n=1 Tax=Neodiprion pinetum TaxID=441929 RepID=UPI00371FF59A